MTQPAHFPDGYSVARYEAAWSNERRVSLADIDDAKSQRRLLAYLKEVRTVLRGWPQLSTTRTDIYCASDVDATLEGEIAQLQQSVADLEELGDE